MKQPKLSPFSSGHVPRKRAPRTHKNEVQPKSLIRVVGNLEEKLSPEEIDRHFKNLPTNPTWRDFEDEFVIKGKMDVIPRNAYPAYLKWLHTGDYADTAGLAKKFEEFDKIELRHEEIYYANGGTTMDEWTKPIVEKFKIVKARELASKMVSIKKIRERINSLKKRIERKMNKLVQHHKLEVMGEKLDRLMNMHKTAIKIIEKNIFSDISEDDLIQGNCLNREVPKEEIAKLEEIICRMFEKIFSQRLF